MATAIVINSDTMGSGDEGLGTTLMSAFLKKIWVRNEKPDTLILYNGGVKLLHKEAGCLDVLNGLEEAGVEILACGTCIAFYEMEKSMEVGRISNMEEIVNIMMTSDKVVTI